MDRLEISATPPPGGEDQTFPQELWIGINGTAVREIFKQMDVAIPADVVRLPSRHLLDSPHPDLSIDGRSAILVCSACGDIGCGALFVRVQLEDDRVIWSDFVYANNWDPEMDDPIEGLFVFELTEYERALAGAED